MTVDAISFHAVRKTVMALAPEDLSGLSVTPNWTALPFLPLLQEMVGGLWTAAIVIVVGAWICAGIAWLAGKVFESSTMQRYSGMTFIWLAIGTMVIGSAVTIVKFFAVQALF